MAAINKVPPIRFKGFEQPWVEKNLGEIFDFDIPTNTLSRADLSENQGEIKNIHYGDILIKYSSCLNIPENNIPYIVSGNLAAFKNHFLKDGDIVFADAAEDEIVGKSIEICNVGNDYVVAGLHTIASRPAIKFQKYYLGYYLNSSSFHGQLISLMQGTKVLSISKNNLKKALINYPVPNEQALVGTYFKQLDGLIQLQEQKMEKVENLKNAMLEKMFPKEGAYVPEVRVKGFTEKWKKKKLREVGSVVMNKRIFKYQTKEIGEIPFYKIGTFGGKADAFISRAVFEDYKAKYPYPNKGDILISASGSIGKTVEYLGDDEYFQDSNIVWLKHDDSILNLFLKYFYSIVKWNGLEGSTIKRLYNSNILNTYISLPSIQEQQKIGEYFQNLDQVVEQSQQKIAQLKHLKQALLQKMFI